MVNHVPKAYVTLFLSVAIIASAYSAISMEINPMLKDGSCPSGYRTSGKYCVPGRNAAFAIKKVGSCPSGYRTSGKYCLAGKNAKHIMIKQGSCPSGYRTSGPYCVKN